MTHVAVAHWNESCNGGGERVAWELGRQFDAPVFVGRRSPDIEPADVDVDLDVPSPGFEPADPDSAATDGGGEP